MHRRKNLIFWRIEKRLKQTEVADKLGVTNTHYSNIERGVTDPSFDLLAKFKRVFKTVDVITLFEKENDTNGY